MAEHNRQVVLWNSGINQTSMSSDNFSTDGQAGIGGYATGGNVSIDTSY